MFDSHCIADVELELESAWSVFVMFFVFLPLVCLLLLPTTLASFVSAVDVSAYQGQIDFQALSDSGYKALYIRAGEGGNLVDSALGENQKGAEDFDLDYGFYYYLTAKTTVEAEEQASHFVHLISDFSYTLRPALDFEVFSALTVEESNDIALSFLRKVEDLTGVRPAIYSDAYEVAQRWSSALAIYPLWVADYAHLVAPETYVLPSGSPWSDWSGYQYSDSGAVSGIETGVDLDLLGQGLFLSSGEGSQTPLPSDFVDYQVKSGDTLSQIAQDFHTTVAVLCQDNHIENPNLIYVGQVLEIPVVDEYKEYQVKSGDTLSHLAQDFHTTVAVLCQQNHIENPNLIYVGQVLSIPSA